MVLESEYFHVFDWRAMEYILKARFSAYLSTGILS